MFDDEIINNSKDFFPIASRSYLLAQLLDILFSHFMSLRNKRENDFNSESRSSYSNNLDEIDNVMKMIENNDGIKANLRRLMAPVGIKTVQGPNVQNLATAANAINTLELLLKSSDNTYLASKRNKENEKINEIDDRNINDDSIDFSLLQTVSLILYLRSYQRKVPVPLPWLQTMIFKHCLDLTAVGKFVLDWIGLFYFV